MDTSSVSLFDYVNYHSFYFSVIVIFEDDLLRIDERSCFFFL